MVQPCLGQNKEVNGARDDVLGYGHSTAKNPAPYNLKGLQELVNFFLIPYFESPILFRAWSGPRRLYLAL
jgi:hypothetical protein